MTKGRSSNEARMPQPCNGLAPEERADILRVRPQGALCNAIDEPSGPYRQSPDRRERSPCSVAVTTQQPDPGALGRSRNPRVHSRVRARTTPAGQRDRDRLPTDESGSTCSTASRCPRPHTAPARPTPPTLAAGEGHTGTRHQSCRCRASDETVALYSGRLWRDSPHKAAKLSG